MKHELEKLNGTTDDHLVIVREFSAPREKVFEVLTNPDHVKKWSCPTSMKITFSEGDVKVGGTYRFGMQSASGKGPEMVLTGSYKEINRPERVVYTQFMEMPDGKKSPETEIEILLEENKGTTQMVFHHSRFPSAGDRDNARIGWTDAFGKLTDLVHSMK